LRQPEAEETAEAMLEATDEGAFAKNDDAAKEDDSGDEPASADVVSLDAFRKKAE